jgi:hypothetical protein
VPHHKIVPYLQQLLVPFEIFLISALTIKHAKAMNITKLSDIGSTSNAAAKSNNIPAPIKTVLHTHVFLFSI